MTVVRRRTPVRYRVNWVAGIVVAGVVTAEAGIKTADVAAFAMFAVVLLTWPLLVLFAVFGLPALGMCLIRDDWRKNYRKAREGQRPAFRRRVERAVFAAYRGRCLYCRRSAGVQVDHIKPWSVGGKHNCLWNSCLLCAEHNRVKSNYWRFRSGRVVYRPWKNAANQALAADILARELRARRNPARWLRTAWVLACA